MKTIAIIILSILCVYLLKDNLQQYDEITTLRSDMSFFNARIVTWETGEKVLFIDGIPNYDIGFALDKNKKLFWYQIGKHYRYSNTHDIVEQGVCSNGYISWRPGGCNSFGEAIKMTDGNKPACVLKFE